METSKFILAHKLENVRVPEEVMNCVDPQCNDSAHKEALDHVASETLKSVERISVECLSSKNKVSHMKQKKNIPGWNDQVKPLKENSSFWYSVWTSAGRPLQGELYNIMKKTRNSYHLAIRKCDRAEDT